MQEPVDPSFGPSTRLAPAQHPLDLGADVGAWLRQRALADPQACAYLYLRDGERDEALYTYSRLDREARAVAAWLLERGQAGDRVLLAHAPGPAFLPAFFGCLYAGMAAVPAFPPRRTAHLERLEALLADCGAALALCDSVGGEALRAMAEASPRWAALRRLEADPATLPLTPGWQAPEQADSALAFLQYTSGSTRSPRGVMVSHANLRHNAGLMKSAFGFDAASVSVSWLPVFHDMGLILGVLQPLFAGVPGILMPPNAFLQKPLRWLQALSRFGGTHSPAPNFAYDLCTAKISPADRAGLDLSAWRCAVNGAEPVRRKTLRHFARAFRAQGFRARALCPAYGLAEGTLFVSGGPAGQGPRLLPPPQGWVESEGAAAAWTGSGQVLGQDLRIVDPETRAEKAAGESGEVWLQGPSVAQGYWQQPQESLEVFGARLADGRGPYLRTGDLGYLSQGQLVICGRLKDLLILRGSNHFPQDLEASVQGVSPDLRPGCGAAFSIEQQGEEALVIVQELQRHPAESLESLAQQIRQVLAQTHGISPVAVALVPPASVPKTSSGKIRRRACRQAFLDGSLNPQHLWRLEEVAKGAGGEDTEAWALDELTRLAQGAAPAAGLQAAFAAWALDSLQVAAFKTALESRTQRKHSLEELYAAPSVASLLAGQGQPPVPVQPSRWALRPLAASFLVAAQAGEEPSRVLVDLEGPLLKDFAAVARALEALRQQHAALRARYVLEDGQAWAVDDGRTLQRPLDLQALGAREFEAAAQALAQHVFDPGMGGLFKALWAPGADGEGRIKLLFDHLAMDGWSVKAWVDGLHAQLQGPAQPQAPVAAPLPADPVSSQADLEAWSQRLQGWQAFPSLPPGFTQGPEPAAFASRLSRIPAPLVQALRQRTAQRGVAPFAAVAAAFAKVWHFWLPQERLVFNLAQHGRGAHDSALGCYADILPLDISYSTGPSLDGLLEQAHEQLLWAQGHAACSGVALARHRAAQRGGRPQAWSPVTLTSGLFYDWHGHPGLRTAEVSFTSPETWLDLAVFKEGAGWALSWNFRLDQVSAARAERLERQLLAVLTALAEGRELQSTELLDAEDLEAHAALEAGYEPIEVQGTLSEAFERRAFAAPSAIAVSDGTDALSYGRLRALSDDLAARLQALGAGPGKVVGIHLPRTQDVVVAILGVLKSGAAYLPMDPLYPRERLAFMAGDAELTALVAAPGMDEDFAAGIERVAPRRPEGEALQAPLAVTAASSDLAYIIYTSGSTGRPKGCMVRQGDVLRLFKAGDRHYDFGPADVWTLFHSYSFDFSVWELWGALLYGGRLVIVPEDEARSPRDFHQRLRAEKVTVLNQTPSAFRALAAVDAALPASERLRDLRWVIFGGEALDYPSLRRWFEQHGEAHPRLVNMYGITETTVHVSFRQVSQRDALDGVGSLIGTPLADMRLRLLDGEGAPSPLGVAGELWVGGGGVALGYWHREELTAQRFVQRADGRYYRSGDLARLIPGKGLEYLGRGDQQIQLRGFRVELGEIQARLLEDPGVGEAAVLALSGAEAELRLAAFVVPADGQSLDLQALRQRLAQHLPPYMLPALCALKALPLTAHGKLDREALPDPWAQAPSGRVAPADALEEQLLKLWCQVLQRPEAGVEDDFFASGGHSLLAASFHQQALRQSHSQVPLKAFLAAPNVRALARALALAPHAPEPLSEAPRRQRATPAQAALWAAQQMDPGSPAYHIAWSHQGSEALDPARVRRALGRLAQEQPALRSAFEQDAQGRLWHFEQGFTEDDLAWDQAQPQSAAQAQAWLEAWSRQPFDLAAAPLWRCAWAPLQEGGWVLGFCVHHLIFDQASFGVWHQALQGTGAGGEEAPYWQALQALPASPPRPAAKLQVPSLADLDGAPGRLTSPELMHGSVGRAMVKTLKKRAQGEGGSLFSAIAAAWAAALCAQHGGEQAAFSVPVSRREGPGSGSLIGYWVEPQAIALSAAPTTTWIERLRTAVRATRELGQGTALPASSAPDLYLAYQGESRLPHELWGQRVLTHRFPSAAPKALAALIVEGEDTLALCLEYDPARLSRARAQALFRALQEALRQLAQSPEELWAPPVTLSQAHGPRLEPSEHRSLVDRLHAQVELDAAALALVWRGGQLSYGHLAQRVQAVAAFLCEQGLEPGQRVGVHGAPGPQWVVSLLGCWQAGLVYVPLDPAYPSSRLRQMAEDADCQVILSDRGPLHWCKIPALNMDKAWQHRGAYLRRPGRPKPQDPAYVVFTSGSTGRPKAVQVPHRALDNLARSMGQALGLGPGDRLLQFVSISFDPSLEEIGSTLARGATLALPCRSGAISPEELAEAAESFGATVLHLPTAYWHACMAAGAARRLAGLPGLRALVVGGEAPDPRWVRAWLEAAAPGHRFYNAYGPSEACVTATLWSCDSGQRVPELVPLGQPLPGVRVALVDAEGQRVPVGQEGELWIGGEGLADGYFEKAGLSQNGFEPAAWDSPAGKRWYHSGDRARMDAQGSLSFVGRRDRQVKLAGHRLELGELEALLRQAPGVAEAAARLEKTAGKEPRLRAWVVPLAGADIRAERLRAWLEQRLPLPVMPRDLEVVPSLALNVNGKIGPQQERAGLPELAEGPPNVLHEELAVKLRGLWQRLLGEPSAGLDADFFALGGGSLLAIRAAFEASAWTRRPVTVGDLIAAPTPRRLAERLEPSSPLMRETRDLSGAFGSLDGLRRLGGSDRGTPMVWVPPAGMTLAALGGLTQALAELGPQWGLETRAPGGPQAWKAWLERSCEAIEAALPQGPLILGGWSVGALLAADLSRALQARGRELQRLVLIDAVQPDPLSAALVAVQPQSLGAWNDEAFRSSLLAVQDFRPQALGVAVSLFISEESVQREPRGAWMAWALQARQGLTSLILPGTHLSLLQGAGAALAAERLRQDLQPFIPSTPQYHTKEVAS